MRPAAEPLGAAEAGSGVGDGVLPFPPFLPDFFFEPRLPLMSLSQSSSAGSLLAFETGGVTGLHHNQLTLSAKGAKALPLLSAWQSNIRVSTRACDKSHLPDSCTSQAANDLAANVTTSKACGCLHMHPFIYPAAAWQRPQRPCAFSSAPTGTPHRGPSALCSAGAGTMSRIHCLLMTLF